MMDILQRKREEKRLAQKNWVMDGNLREALAQMGRAQQAGFDKFREDQQEAFTTQAKAVRELANPDDGLLEHLAEILAKKLQPAMKEDQSRLRRTYQSLEVAPKYGDEGMDSALLSSMTGDKHMRRAGDDSGQCCVIS